MKEREEREKEKREEEKAEKEGKKNREANRGGIRLVDDDNFGKLSFIEEEESFVVLNDKKLI